ncbi:hypothetical protein TNCV_382791 [Trichonephila clavipes]|nr:hypothetical protein TNCV_382791 [Trichonephila clavipes]
MVLFRNGSPEEQRMRAGVDMMDLRSAQKVESLDPRQFQEIKEVIKSSHVLPARSQKTKVWATDRPSDFRRFARRECP